MKKIFILILVLALIQSALFADIFPKAGTAGLQFLKLGIDARAVGMGQAYTAYTNDASSSYWNPAGLALLRRNELFINHISWPANINYEYATYAYVTTMGTFAISSGILHMDYMDITDEDTFGPTGEEFTCGDAMVGASYAVSLTDKFSFGGTVKYLREYLYEYDVNGWSVDVGTLYNTGWKNLTIGMSLRNFGPNLRYKVDNDEDGEYDEDPYDWLDNDGDGKIDEDGEELLFPIPMNFSLGVAIDIIKEQNQGLNAVLQLDNCIDRQETWNIGAEYRYKNLFLRSGYQFEYDTNGLSFGVGVKIPTSFAILKIDYAYTDMGDLVETFLKGAHRLSLKFSF
ncbi:MAG: hypothetical protein DRH57_01380 [Candidatus Cloacimonadota bacterium]|nr:MAG: hypothetical protein DRH57_01380 [Candidatus Cloacimonadota bacterium]